MWVATWKITGHTWVPGRRGFHGLRGPHDILHEEMDDDILLRDYDSVCSDLAVLLVIGGVEKNPGPGAEAEKIMQVSCSRCDRNLRSGTQFDTCGC